MIKKPQHGKNIVKLTDFEMELVEKANLLVRGVKRNTSVSVPDYLNFQQIFMEIKSPGNRGGNKTNSTGNRRGMRNFDKIPQTIKHIKQIIHGYYVLEETTVFESGRIESFYTVDNPKGIRLFERIKNRNRIIKHIEKATGKDVVWMEKSL